MWETFFFSPSSLPLHFLLTPSCLKQLESPAHTQGRPSPPQVQAALALPVEGVGVVRPVSSGPLSQCPHPGCSLGCGCPAGVCRHLFRSTDVLLTLRRSIPQSQPCLTWGCFNTVATFINPRYSEKQNVPMFVWEKSTVSHGEKRLHKITLSIIIVNRWTQ